MNAIRSTTLSRLAFAAIALIGTIGLAHPTSAQTAVSIGTAKDPNVAAQIVIAREKGFFKEAGLDAAINDFPSGGDLMAALVGGSVQMGSAGISPVVTLRSRPYPVVIVARVSDISGIQQLIVEKDVQKPEDLYGKKIGIMRGTDSEAFFSSVVEGYGLNASQFQLINLNPTEMIQAFVQKDVSAIAVWEPHATRAREAGQGKTLISGTQSFIPGKEGPKRVYGGQAVLFASEDFVAKQPDTVKRVLSALDKANAFIVNNRSEALNIMAKAFQLTPKQMADIADRNAYTLTLDNQMVSDIEKFSQFLLSAGKISKPLDVATAIDSAPLRAFSPSLVKLK
jgi:ABC-type nitrate/sulfonate/bicarbonate transport system substrate-binding protein